MRRHFLLPLVLAAACTAAPHPAPRPAVAASAAADSLAVRLQAILADEVAANPSLPGELMHVHAPARGIDRSFAVGWFDRPQGQPLDPHHGFRVASVTKTFTAASILRLMEEGRLGLDDAIPRHLSRETLAALEGDGYATATITIRHLLHHTAGVYDYATDQRFFAAAFANPAHRWTRSEQVDSAMVWGAPYFAPGAGFHYADTGYLLLAEIIERVTGRPLAEAFRTLLNFERVGLDETYLETLEPVPAQARELSHPYFGEMDGIGFDASLDLYGGGGIVSTTEDLARFYRALLRGEVFREPRTLELMLTMPATNTTAVGGGYAMGMQRRIIGGHTCWGHTGFWGTAAFHCPDIDLTVVRHINQAQPAQGFRISTLYDRLLEALGPQP